MKSIKTGSFYTMQNPCYGFEEGVRAVVLKGSEHAIEFDGWEELFIMIIHPENWTKNLYASINAGAFKHHFTPADPEQDDMLNGWGISKLERGKKNSFSFDLFYKNEFKGKCEYKGDGSDSKFLVADCSAWKLLEDIIEASLPIAKGNDLIEQRRTILNEFSFYLSDALYKGAMSFTRFLNFKVNQFQY